VCKTSRHTSFYLACGARDGPLIIFAHGWPELSHSWRHQLTVFAALGFRAIAPDMRGYGRSTVHPKRSDYTLEAITTDMIELLESLDCDKAIWVGHDWGAPVVWALASHNPDRCEGVAGLCVPYMPNAESALPYIDRSLYPEDRYPAGQWDYVLNYQESFDRTCAQFEADVQAMVKLSFRRGDPALVGRPSFSATVRADGGWFGGRPAAPDMPRDPLLLTEADLCIYTEALTRNGFAGPCSWYVNGEANDAYGRASVNGGRLDMPVLFVHAAYDPVCQTLTSRLADPMRGACSNLTEVVVNTGHWVPQENPVALNKALVLWISAQLAHRWHGYE
jgi:pimeloyl-ACP methyl ester carboxylesterase